MVSFTRLFVNEGLIGGNLAVASRGGALSLKIEILRSADPRPTDIVPHAPLIFLSR